MTDGGTKMGRPPEGRMRVLEAVHDLADTDATDDYGGVATATLADELEIGQDKISEHCRHLVEDGDLKRVRGLGLHGPRDSFVPAEDADDEIERLVTDGGTRRSNRPSWVPGTGRNQARCQNCGSHIQRDIARVYGDNDDVLWHCPECDDPDISPRDLRNGAGKDPDYDPTTDRVQSTRSGRYPMDGGDL